MGSGLAGNKHRTDSHSVKEDDLLHRASIQPNQCFLFFLRTVPRMSKKSLDTRRILGPDAGSVVTNPPQSLSQEGLLEKEMATQAGTLAWEIPWMEEPGGPPSTGSQKTDTAEHLRPPPPRRW